MAPKDFETIKFFTISRSSLQVRSAFHLKKIKLPNYLEYDVLSIVRLILKIARENKFCIWILK